MAQDGDAVDFEGGKLTITEVDDGQRAVAFDGKELGRNYFVMLDRIAEVDGRKVALFSIGSGGNACSPQTLIVWKPEGGEIKSLLAGDDCGAPQASVNDETISFVPYPAPGTVEDVWRWDPDGGLKLAGRMAFAPQPGTDWETLKSGEPGYGFEAFDNAAVYEAAQKMLGGELAEVARGFLTGSRMERIDGGLLIGGGCVPHACGVADGFIAIDPEEQKLYIAQQADGEPRTWPEVGEWPPEALEAMHKALVGN